MKTTKQKERKPGRHSTYSTYFIRFCLDLNVIIAYFLYCGNYEIYQQTVLSLKRLHIPLPSVTLKQLKPSIEQRSSIMSLGDKSTHCNSRQSCKWSLCNQDQSAHSHTPHPKDIDCPGRNKNLLP